MHTLSFGFDIGGVIGTSLDALTGPGDLGTSLPDALKVIRGVCRLYGSDRQYIISRVRADDRRDMKFRQLEAWDFYNQTNFRRENIFIYNGERAEKVRFAIENKLTHLVDDKLEILSQLPEYITPVAFAPDPAETARFLPLFGSRPLIIVETWQEFAAQFKIPV